jgi:formate hydrogenlyase subunit 3/multisubunit Na+/H+ antiporter MnhD subunit
LALLVNVIAIAGMFMANGFWGGLAQFQDTFSPYNIINYLMEVVLIAPALLASWWQDKRRSKKTVSQQP